MPNVKRDGVPVEGKCPKCGADLVMRFGRYGAFIGCTNYRAEPPCDYTRDLNVPEGAAGTAASAEPADAAPIEPCEKCGRPMALAGALQKLDAIAHRVPMQVAPAVAPLAQVNPLSAFGGGVAKLFSTHPSTADRVARLQRLANSMAA